MIDEQAVMNKLDTLISALTEVQEVYLGIPNTIEKYPSVFITPVSWEEEFADLRDNTVIMSFNINVLIQLNGAGLTAQSNLRAIVKSLREVLGKQENITLDGIVDSSRLTSGQYSFDQKETMLGFCQITYTVRKRFNRFA